jgi:uncharacterized small protein (TIGR04563 family)
MGHMSTSDKRKQSLYFPEEMLKEMQAEATRQDRSLSWIVQKAWRTARKELAKYPSSTDHSEKETNGLSQNVHHPRSDAPG